MKLNPKTTIEKRAKEIDARMELLKEYVNKVRTNSEASWGHAGDLGNINEKLHELMVFIGAEQEETA